MSRKIEKIVDDLQRSARNNEESASAYVNAAGFFMTVGVAGAVALGLGLSNSNEDLQWGGLGVGFLAPVPVFLNRARQRRIVAADYHAQARVAQEAEVTMTITDYQIATQVSEQIPNTLKALIQNGDLLRLLGTQQAGEADAAAAVSTTDVVPSALSDVETSPLELSQADARLHQPTEPTPPTQGNEQQ
ncbi:MAG: hypothetical protein ABWX94_00775 [Candidatus Saccharimonadales bacterium]